MRYLADILTLFRLIAGPLVALFCIQNHWQAATVLFAAGILSDAFDGMVARRWPYTKLENEHLFWRKNPDAWDNLADATLVAGVMVGLLFTQLHWLLAVAIMVGNVVISRLCIWVIDMKKKSSLRWALALDLFYRWFFGAQLATALLWLTVLATDRWGLWFILYGVMAIILLRLKWDHATFRDDPTYEPIR
jgi:phosphatidylglycerophosphate synthase